MNWWFRAALLGLTSTLLGCGSTRLTDTTRTATEMLLVSNAIDQAVDHLDFQGLDGEKVFLDTQFVGEAVDKGYLVSSVRQRIVQHGCYLQENREDAEYVVELRSGAIGTDRYELLVGVPEMNLPAVIPGQPSVIPEIPVVKKTDQQGVAKLAVFIYERESGMALAQSGVLRGQSESRDTWVMGAGPFRRGSITDKTVLAGHDLEFPDLTFSEDPDALAEVEENISVTAAAAWNLPKPPVANTTQPENALAQSPSEPEEPSKPSVLHAVHEVEESTDGPALILPEVGETSAPLPPRMNRGVLLPNAPGGSW